MPGLGLKASLDDMLEDLARRHGDVRFTAELPEGDWGGTLEVLVLRAVREAVNNAFRHGRPSHISIRITADGGRLAFAVTDDGGGLKPGGLGGGFGLIGMRERVEAAGGELTVSELPLPRGVSVEGYVPLPKGTGPAEGWDGGRTAAMSEDGA